jgi:hypothetical protein
MKHPTQNPTTDSDHNKPMSVRPTIGMPTPRTPAFVRIAMTNTMLNASAQENRFWVAPTHSGA